jgi:hypothetical protein
MSAELSALSLDPWWNQVLPKQQEASEASGGRYPEKEDLALARPPTVRDAAISLFGLPHPSTPSLPRSLLPKSSPLWNHIYPSLKGPNSNLETLGDVPASELGQYMAFHVPGTSSYLAHLGRESAGVQPREKFLPFGKRELASDTQLSLVHHPCDALPDRDSRVAQASSAPCFSGTCNDRVG